jgi:tRNA U38,U39,U40 pseudouridine synthase TruA
MIEKIIVGCMLICKGSIEDTQRFINWIFNIWVSIGKISNTINAAAAKAEKWNSSIDLSAIKTGANDEIFQGRKPVLVGVEPDTTFIYLLEGANKRDSATWAVNLLEKEKNQNLKLETTVNDGGKGLRKGLKEAYPNIIEQLDVFHTEYDFSKAVYSSERRAYKYIKEEEKLRKKSLKKPSDKNIKKYNEIIEKTKESVDTYDILNTLYLWILELLSVGGYFFEERIKLLGFIIENLEIIPNKNIYLVKAIKFLKENQNIILQFVKKAELLIKEMSIEENIPEEALRKIWKKSMYSVESAEYNYIEAEIGRLLGKRYHEINRKWKKLMKNIVRASSIVECINSLIRPYLFLKKEVPDKFLALLQFYFNTRKYRRSRRTEREKKSPYELLTGNEHGNPLEILGFK